MMKHTFVKYGIIAGVSVVAYFLLFYFIDTTILFSPFVNWGSLVIYLTFMIMACTRERVSHEGSLPFKQALRTAFGTFVVANIIYYIFNYLLFKFDPTLLITQKEAIIHTMQWASKTFNFELPSETIQQLRGEIRPVTIGNTLFVFAQSLIGGFILSFIVGGMMRR